MGEHSTFRQLSNAPPPLDSVFWTPNLYGKKIKFRVNTVNQLSKAITQDH